jgi:hypothetical protein
MYARLTSAIVATVVTLSVACSGSDDSAESDRVNDRPSTTAEGEEAPPTSEEGPLYDPDLAAAIPAIDGVRFADAGVPNHYAVLRLPVDAHLVREAIEVDGVPSGFVTVAEQPDGMDYETFEDTVVDAFFAEPVEIVRDETETEDGVYLVANSADPQWNTYGEEFVMEAVVERDGRWEWFWDDLLWIVEGTPDERSFVEQLIGAQHKLVPPDDYDTFVIAGELNDRFADLADYTYIDLPRTDLIGHLPDESVAGTCADQWLPFGVAKDPDDGVIDADNVFVQMAAVGARCDTFAEDFRAMFMGYPGAHDESISGVATIVGDRVIGWFEDGVAYAVSAETPGALANYRPFIEGFIEFQADVPTDD